MVRKMCLITLSILLPAFSVAASAARSDLSSDESVGDHVQQRRNGGFPDEIGPIYLFDAGFETFTGIDAVSASSALQQASEEIKHVDDKDAQHWQVEVQSGSLLGHGEKHAEHGTKHRDAAKQEKAPEDLLKTEEAHSNEAHSEGKTPNAGETHSDGANDGKAAFKKVAFKLSDDKKSWKADEASGMLSQKKDVFLPELAVKFGLPKDTIHSYQYAFPDPAFADDAGTTPMTLFKKLGGFVYFGDCGNVVAVKGVAPLSLLVKFGAGEDCVSCNFHKCPGASGFVDYYPVTLPALASLASHYCFLDADTCMKINPRHQDGCFSFMKKHGGTFTIFPIATQQKEGTFPSALEPFLLFNSPKKPVNVSQWHFINLPAAAREAQAVPADAKSFKFVYGMGEGFEHGGFFYSPVQQLRKVVLPQYKMEFAAPLQVSLQAIADSCAPWREVSDMEKERLPGAKKFCWDPTDSGSFIYEMEDGTVIQFPVETPLEA